MRTFFYLLVLVFFSASLVQAQPASPIATGSISGQVIDSLSNTPVAFATVTLASSQTGKPVDGTITDEKGFFSFSKTSFGSYQL